MALGVATRAKRTGGRFRLVPQWAWLMLLVPIASCVPAASMQGPSLAVAVAADLPDQAVVRPLFTGDQALAANAALPVTDGLGPAAGAFVFRASTPIDQMRSLDCLSQAVYYEARSESEDGQRAVAQVVLNRVRHPAWPNSVCGVVYQGPLRAGGGCQFTFTCDGSLARAPEGIQWARARMIAAEALGGRTFAGVGLSTFYHTSAVFPAWAPRLVKTAVIGAHNFYRLPGTLGSPDAFSSRYAGNEPVPHPAAYLPGLRGNGAAQVDVAAWTPPAPAAPIVPSDIPQDPRWAPNNLPDSTIREEHRQSGQWRDDAPAAITGGAAR